MRRRQSIAATIAAAAVYAVAACGSAQSSASAGDVERTTSVAPGTALDTATFAGGCFWCMEPPFDELRGVVSTTSGYMGGTVVNPTYKQVSAGGTGHAEVVRVIFDPSQVSYARLVEVFWRNVDPLTPNRQFCDAGDMYRSAIFHHDDAQQRVAVESKAALERSGRFRQPIVTQIVPASTFYEAEEYHQDYYKKNPIRYKFYRSRCGRDARLAEVWGDES